MEPTRLTSSDYCEYEGKSFGIELLDILATPWRVITGACCYRLEKDSLVIEPPYRRISRIFAAIFSVIVLPVLFSSIIASSIKARWCQEELSDLNKKIAQVQCLV